MTVGVRADLEMVDHAPEMPASKHTGRFCSIAFATAYTNPSLDSDV